MSDDKGLEKGQAPDEGAEADLDPNHYHLRLYVAGQTAKSLAATANLRLDHLLSKDLPLTASFPSTQVDALDHRIGGFWNKMGPVRSPSTVHMPCPRSSDRDWGDGRHRRPRFSFFPGYDDDLGRAGIA